MLFAALLACTGVAKADVTDVPEMSTEGSIKWYTISNTRSTSGKYLYWTESGVKDANTLSGSSLFYFTGDDASACFIHNAATNLLFSGKGAWTAAGVSCKISETPHSSRAGVAIEFSGTSLNENNYDNGFTTWSANDAGSIFVIAPATVSIEEAIAGLDANKAAGNTIMGEYKYEEESYNKLVAALATLNSATGTEAATAFENCAEIMSSLAYVMPEEGKFYVIECPLFKQVQGVSKGLNGTPAWNTIDLTDKNYYWTVEVKDGTYALKNLGTGTYLNGTSMSADAAYATLALLGEEQFNIVVNGTTVHADGHSGGASASGNLVNWGGGANSASAWCFVQKNDPTASQKVTVKYSFTYGDDEKYTQETVTLVGEEWPDITVSFPYGVVSAAKPEGVIADADVTDGVATKVVELSIKKELPFETAADASNIKTWYYAKMHTNQPGYLGDIAKDNTINVANGKSSDVASENFVWGFVGDVFGGVIVVNKGTGLQLTSTGSGNVTLTENGTLFFIAETRETTVNAEYGFCLRKTDSNNYLNANHVRGKLEHYSVADAGSTMFLTEYEETEATVSETAGWATMYLDYAVYIPEGVNAYTVTGVENGYVTLTQLEGAVPANTGVLLENAGKFTFIKAAKNVAAAADNLLCGSVKNTYVEGVAYVLANGESGVGLYRAELNKDANGADGKTHFKNNANKAYLPITSNAPMFSFDRGEGTSSIDKAQLTMDNVVIYDLLGRRVEKMEKGIYIVNGKKIIK